MMTPWQCRIANASKEQYNQLLYDATGTGGPNDVSALLEKGAMLAAFGKKMDTALHLAARRGLTKQLSILASCFVDLSVKNAKDQTPLSWAAKRGHLECIGILLKHHMPSDDVENALVEAVKARQSTSVNALLTHLVNSKGMKRCEKYIELIEWAVVNQDKDTIDIFTNRGFSINGGNFVVASKKQGWFGPFIAHSESYQNQPRLNASLFELEGYKSCPLMVAIQRGDFDMVQWLVLKKKATVDLPVFNEDKKRGHMGDYADKHGQAEIKEFLKNNLVLDTAPNY